jgi:hypothetical protein
LTPIKSRSTKENVRTALASGKGAMGVNQRYMESAFEFVKEPVFESEKVPASPAGPGISIP